MTSLDDSDLIFFPLKHMIANVGSGFLRIFLSFEPKPCGEISSSSPALFSQSFFKVWHMICYDLRCLKISIKKQQHNVAVKAQKTEGV